MSALNDLKELANRGEDWKKNTRIAVEKVKAAVRTVELQNQSSQQLTAVQIFSSHVDELLEELNAPVSQSGEFQAPPEDNQGE